MLREPAESKDVPFEEKGEEISQKMNDIVAELSSGDHGGDEMADDGTFEYYGNGKDFLEEGTDSMVEEMFCNSDNPFEDADGYANMMAERAAEDDN